MTDQLPAPWLWWTPPEVGPTEFPTGLWMVGKASGPDDSVGPGGADGMPAYGDVLGDGPADASVDWLAA